MKPYNFSPERKKLYLRTLLLGALGFSLSMSPEQFNNIVRNDGNSGVFDMALTSEEAEARRMEMARENVKPKNSTAAAKNLLGQAPAKDKKAEATSMTDDQKEAQRMKEAQSSAAASAERINEGSTRSLPATGQNQKPAGQQSTTGESNVRRMTVEEIQEYIAKATNDATTVAVKKAKDEMTAELIAAMRAELEKQAASNNAKLPQGAQTATTAGATTAPVPGTPVGPATRSETGTANAAGTTTVATTAAATPAPISRDLVLGKNNEGLCRVSFSNENEKVTAKAEKVTEAMTCPLPEKTSLKGSIKDLPGLLEEMKALYGKAETKEDKKEKDKEAQKEKLEALKEKYEELAEKCDDDGETRLKSVEGKLNCLKNLMVKFAKDTKEIKDAKRELAAFFNAKVAPTIKSAMSRSVWEVDENGVARANTERIDAAQETIMSLVESLPSKNTQPIISSLASIHAMGFNAQAGHAREIYLQSQTDKNSLNFKTRGIALQNERIMANFLSQPYQKGQFGRNYRDWADALESSGKDVLLDDVKSRLFTPTLAWMNKLPTESDYLMQGIDKKSLASAKLKLISLSGFGMGSGFNTDLGIITENRVNDGLPEGLTFGTRVSQQVDYRGNTIPGITDTRGAAKVTTGTAATVKTRTGRGAGLLN